MKHAGDTGPRFDNATLPEEVGGAVLQALETAAFYLSVHGGFGPLFWCKRRNGEVEVISQGALADSGLPFVEQVMKMVGTVEKGQRSGEFETVCVLLNSPDPEDHQILVHIENARSPVAYDVTFPVSMDGSGIRFAEPDVDEFEPGLDFVVELCSE